PLAPHPCSATILHSFALSQNGLFSFQPLAHSFALCRGEGVHRDLPSICYPDCHGRSGYTRSFSQPNAQGVPCSRFALTLSSTLTPTNLLIGGNPRQTRATSTPMSSRAAACSTKPCSPCSSTSSNPTSPARFSPWTMSRKRAASLTPTFKVIPSHSTTKD